MLIALDSAISNSQVFLLKICKSYSHFFSKNISTYAIFNDQSFNDTLTDDIVRFEQLGPGRVSAILYEVTNFCESLFAFPAHQNPSEKRSPLKSKEFAAKARRLLFRK